MTVHRYAYELRESLHAVMRLGALLIVLNTGLVLPAVLVTGGSSVGLADLLSFDLAGLLAVIVLARGTRMQRSAGRMATALYAMFLLYEIYDAAMRMALKRPGLLYDDVQHIGGAVHLIGNAATSQHFAIGAVGIAGGVGFCWFAGRAFRQMNKLLEVRSARRISVLGLWLCLALVTYGLAFDLGNHTPLYGESVMMTGEKIAGNLGASAQLRQRVQTFNRLPADSTYAQYETVSLPRRPNVFILFIESYGEVLRRDGETAAAFAAMMRELDDRLSRSGWMSASTTSVAPVNGGTSWLSVGSVLTGMTMEHQSLFNVVERKLDQYPHLIHALQEQGYRTAALQPPTRPRLGVGVSNPYGFDETFYFADMAYTGPRYGWGIVPDQYSLNLAHEQFVAPAESPVALMFEMVASHAPWGPPPPFVQDWRTLNEPDPHGRLAARPTEAAREAQPPVVTTASAPESPLPNVSADEGAPIHRLFRTIRYDWQVIAEYMANRMPDSSLVLVLGDHQPPVVSTNSDAVPVHVFSQNPSHIDAAIANGFRRGLSVSQQDESIVPPFQHAGLYSLIMNLLTQPVGREMASPPPPVLPEGVSRPALRRSASP